MTPMPCRYDGIQESMAPGLVSFALYTIWAPIGPYPGHPLGHPYGSTLSLNTLTEAGYTPVERKEPA